MTIAVIGFGGAGGNIANEAASKGIPSGAVNFSQEDLNSLVEVKHKLKLLGSDGVGHDRSLAMALTHEHYPLFKKFAIDYFSNPNIDIIFLPFACGGGSGSGMAPMLAEMLSYEMPNKVIVACPILPSENEVLIPQTNSYYAMDDISNLNLCILPIDNNEAYRAIDNGAKNKVFEFTNSSFVNLLAQIVGYTERASKNGNFDKKDLINVFSQKGIGIIGECDIASLPKVNITPDGIAHKVYESWENSIFAPIEYSHVSKCAFIYDGQDGLIEHIDYRKIFSKFNHGVPMDIFEGYYEDSHGKIFTILTGLQWCTSRIEHIEKLIESQQEKAEIILSSNTNEQFKAKKFDFTQKIQQKPQKIAKELPIQDILNKYKR